MRLRVSMPPPLQAGRSQGLPSSQVESSAVQFGHRQHSYIGLCKSDQEQQEQRAQFTYYHRCFVVTKQRLHKVNLASHPQLACLRSVTHCEEA